jgi:hypothetical protein
VIASVIGVERLGVPIVYLATGGTFGQGVFVQTGAATDLVSVMSALPGVTTAILTGPGNDTVNVSVPSDVGYNGLALNGGPGIDSLNVFAANVGAVVQTTMVSSTSGFIDFDFPPPGKHSRIVYEDFEIVATNAIVPGS